MEKKIYTFSGLKGVKNDTFPDVNRVKIYTFPSLKGGKNDTFPDVNGVEIYTFPGLLRVKLEEM